LWLSIAAMLCGDFNLGIDFKGGSLLEVDYPQGRPAQTEVVNAITPLNLDASVRATGDAGIHYPNEGSFSG
jgi:preprotein translocase subunit SecF